MINEKEKLYSYFQNEINSLKTYKDYCKDFKFSDFFLNMENSEAPDLISKVDNTHYIIEHFEFDSSKNKKSSQYRRELARVNREIINNKKTIYRDIIKINHSTENYLESIQKNFEKHYNKIPQYIMRLKEKCIIKNNIKICFFIEDTSCFGTQVLYEDKIIELFPFNIKEFIDYFEEKIEVDYLIIGIEATKKIWFISRDMINELRKDEILKDDIRIIPFEPKVISYKVEI